MNARLIDEALKLSTQERLDLIARVWDSLTDSDVPVTDEEKAILDRRLIDLEENPGDQSPWSEVKTRLAKRRP